MTRPRFDRMLGNTFSRWCGLCRGLVAVVLLIPMTALAQADRAAAAKSSLFDGQTLQGWTVLNEAEATVADGLLQLKNGNGWLRSDFTYADFKMHVEWKALQAADYDSGIYIRTPPDPGKPFARDGYQINLLQGQEGNIKNLKGAESTGLIKPGEWNAFDITVIGDTVELTINGKKAWKASGIKHRAGHVGLQCEVTKGGQFQFRNIHITELDYKPLFNGKDLTGWEGGGAAADKCWVVQDGELHCTGQPGPWLKSVEQFGDFSLRLEFLVTAGGNSGVYVRVPADGNHHRENDTAPPAGFEVQLLDDEAAQYRNLKDYQYSASVYDICGAKPRAMHPAGQWNTLELTCVGQHVTSILNGVTVVDITAESHPLLKQRQTKGFLGLQNHNTLVKFRNVRVASAK
ncbi:MAG: DUF1080 domain-containing protein [Planctomycetales bacterium]|nr:DUF1080 domain-containing protein [Planctomycetales bacterium]